MTRKVLAGKIDALGKLRDKLHALKFTERALTGDVVEAIKALPGKIRTAQGAQYSAEIITSDKLVIENLPGLKRAAGRKFLRCVKADIAEARRQLGAAVLDKLGTIQHADQLRVYKREPGKAPRKAAGKAPPKTRRKAARS